MLSTDFSTVLATLILYVSLETYQVYKADHHTHKSLY